MMHTTQKTPHSDFDTLCGVFCVLLKCGIVFFKVVQSIFNA